ncbi:MAG: 3-deoxy-manno-octulosonate-8-phosphatase KdsC [Arenicellales bacterium]
MKQEGLKPDFFCTEEVIKRARKIRLLLFDVDGVLTDGRLYFSDNGDEGKSFHSRDGLGINLLQQTGVAVGIITARESSLVAHRARDINIQHLYQGRKEKFPAYEEVCKKLELSPNEVSFVGDDVVDLPIMLDVGLAVTVPQGHNLVKQHAHWTTRNEGGAGAARDVCELLMYAQGTYNKAMEQFLTTNPGS